METGEIDSLEIVIQAEAEKANRSLTGLEKRINKATDALQRFMVMAQGGVSFKNVDVDKLFSGSAMDSAAQKQGRKLADSLISGFNLKKAGPEVERQVKELSQKIAGGLSANKGKPYDGMSSDLDALGRITARNGSIAKSTSEEYQKLYNWIKTTSKIKISPETAKSLGDSYKNRNPLMKQKLSTKSGIELDSFYNEAKDMFPGILKEAYNVEDEFQQLNSAMEKFCETSNSFYKPDWLEDAAYESVATGVSDIVEEIKKAQKESTDLSVSLNGVADTGKSFSDIFGSGMDTSGFERVIALANNVRNQGGSGRASRSDLKYPADSFENLSKKFSGSTFDIDFSGMGEKQLKKKINEYERGYNRIKQEIANIQELEGTDNLGGKAWYSKIMQMNQYENAIYSATEALGKLEDAQSIADVKINRGNINTSSNSEKLPETAQLGGYVTYDSSAIQAQIDGFRSATEKASTFEAQIKQLKATLKSMGEAGLGQYDPQYDAVYRELKEVERAKKEYDLAMKTPEPKKDLSGPYRRVSSAIDDATKKANVFKKVLNSVGGASKNINTTKKKFDNISKAIKNAKSMANKAIHPFKTLKKLMGTSDDGGNGRRMNLGRMVGSSILFSSVFGMISQIKQAVKEGSDNLVQYSSEYNNSISGMVSSLLYLKNAWAVAFAPIANVVGPYVSSFIDMIASALNAVGQFMAALTGKGFVVQAKKAWKDYGASLGDTAKGSNKANDAAKKLQKTILGFDELNVLNGKDDSSGSGGSGSGSTGSPTPSDMFETIEVPNSMNTLADKFKEAMKNSDFTEIGEIVGNKLKSTMENIPWDEIYHKADNFGKGLATFLNGLISPELFYDLGATLAGALNTAFHALNSFAENFDWSDFGRSIASSIKGFFENWDAGLTAETFSNFGKGLLESITGFINGLADDATWETIGKKVVDFICGVDWLGLEWDIAKFFEALTNAIIDFPADFAKGIAQGILDKIFGENEVKLPEVKWFDDLTTWIQSLSIKQLPLFDCLFNFTDTAKLFKDLKEGIGRIKEKMKEHGGNIVAGLGEGIVAAFGTPIEWISKYFPLIGAFAKLFGIHSLSTVFHDFGGHIMDGLSEGLTEKLQPILDFFGDLKDKIVEKFDDVKDWFGEKFGKAREKVEGKFSDLGSWFGERKKDVQNGMKDVGDWFGTKFQNARTNVNKSFSDVGTWFGKRKTDIQSGVKDIDTWMNTKFTTARTNVNNAFSNVGSWFSTRKSEIQTGMSSIDTWMNTKYQSARGYVNNAFSGVGSWFGSRKGDIQSNMESISAWFNTKYQSARWYVNSAFNNVGSWFGSRRNDIQSNMASIINWFRTTFQFAYNAITGIFNNIGSYFWRIAENIKAPIKNALNGVIGGVNWVLGKLGSGTRFSYVNFATGTGPDGVTKDTIGMVNDQSGNTYKELVQFPNGKTIIPKGRNVMMPLPKGTKVLPAGKTKELMNMNGIQHFKNGAGVFSIFDYIGHPRKLMQHAVDKFVSFKGAIEPGLSMAKSAVSTVFDSAVSSIKGALQSFGKSIQNATGSGVERWRNLAKTALLLTGLYTESNLNALLTQMKHESGGNPRAINLWDSNAKKGIPSKGLMQVIDPTFKRWAIPGHNSNIYDPLSNMIAAIRYTVSRYGSLYNGWTARGYKGYAGGGYPMNGEVYVANENGFGSEYIGRMGNKHVVANNQQITDGIKQAVIEGMMEVFMATNGNGENEQVPIVLNAVLKTEDDEVLARAVERGQAKRNSRFSPSPAY